MKTIYLEEVCNITNLYTECKYMQNQCLSYDISEQYLNLKNTLA